MLTVTALNKNTNRIKHFMALLRNTICILHFVFFLGGGGELSSDCGINKVHDIFRIVEVN